MSQNLQYKNRMKTKRVHYLGGFDFGYINKKLKPQTQNHSKKFWKQREHTTYSRKFLGSFGNYQNYYGRFLVLVKNNARHTNYFTNILIPTDMTIEV